MYFFIYFLRIFLFCRSFSLSLSCFRYLKLPTSGQMVRSKKQNKINSHFAQKYFSKLLDFLLFFLFFDLFSDIFFSFFWVFSHSIRFRFGCPLLLFFCSEKLHIKRLKNNHIHWKTAAEPRNCQIYRTFMYCDCVSSARKFLIQDRKFAVVDVLETNICLTSRNENKRKVARPSCHELK